MFVMDTKWKVLSLGKRNYDIESADMYQMFAYLKRYSASSVTLIWPRVEGIENLEFDTDDGVNVKVRFIDLFDAKNSLQEILEVVK